MRFSLRLNNDLKPAQYETLAQAAQHTLVQNIAYPHGWIVG